MRFTMRRLITPVIPVALLLAGGTRLAAQGPGAATPAAAITALLQRQSVDWNRGDLDAFATGYKNSPEILFIGKTVEHGYQGMLAGYKRHYPTRETMGILSFSQLEVQPLDPDFATCTGHFHLERTKAGGGAAEGYFLLVLEHTGSGWKIVRDDTSSLPTAKP